MLVELGLEHRHLDVQAGQVGLAAELRLHLPRFGVGVCEAGVKKGWGERVGAWKEGEAVV